MKRIVGITIVFHVFMVAAMIVVFNHSAIRYQRMSTPPHGMSSNSCSFYVYFDSGSDTPYEEKWQTILEQCNEAFGRDYFMLAYPHYSYGIGVTGTHPALTQMHLSPTEVWIKEGSYADLRLRQGDTLTTSEGTLTVTGRYGEGFVFQEQYEYADPYDYIFNLASIPLSSGSIYFDSPIVDAPNKIARIFRQNNYFINNYLVPEITTYSPSLWRCLVTLYTNPLESFFRPMLFALLFIYGNYIFFSLATLKTVARTLSIRRLLGASRRQIFAYLLSRYSIGMAFGALLGISLTCLWYASTIPNTAIVIALALIAHLFLSFLSFVILFVFWTIGEHRIKGRMVV